jgi:hypothetical protein
MPPRPHDRAGPMRTLSATGPIPSFPAHFLDDYLMAAPLLHNGQPMWLGAKNGVFARACCGQRAGVWAFLDNRAYYALHNASFRPSPAGECTDTCHASLILSSGQWQYADSTGAWRPANVSMNGPLTAPSVPLTAPSITYQAPAGASPTTTTPLATPSSSSNSGLTPRGLSPYSQGHKYI